MPQTDPSVIYKKLYLIRRVEEVTAEIYPTDVIKSPIHLSIGQEHVSVGICAHLRPDDIVAGTYRSHALYLAKGGSVKALFAEMFGKAAGCSGGRGGSMHLIDPEHNIMGTSAVVGTTIPNAAGAALALKMQKKDAIVACFFGDGASEEGCFYETLNFAAVKKLPILFVCENNGLAIHSHIAKRRKQESLCIVAEALGVQSLRIPDLLDFGGHGVGWLEIAIERMRKLSVPFFVEAPTHRLREHVGPGTDYDKGYRVAPIARDFVKEAGMVLDATVRAEIEREVEQTITDAIMFAKDAPEPDPATLYENVYA